MGEERGVAGGRRVVDGGKLLLLHRRLVLWVVVSRVTGVAPAPLATGRGATLPAGGGIGVRMGGGLGLRQQRGRSGLSLVQEFVRLFYFVSFYLYVSGKVLSPELQGLQSRWRRERRGRQRVGNVGAVVGEISSRYGRLGPTLRAGFGVHSAAFNARRTTVLHFTH